MLKTRLKMAEKRLIPKKPGVPIRMWTVKGRDEKELAAGREEILAGKVKNSDGGFYDPETGNKDLFIFVIHDAVSGEVERGVALDADGKIDTGEGRPC